MTLHLHTEFVPGCYRCDLKYRTITEPKEGQ